MEEKKSKEIHMKVKPDQKDREKKSGQVLTYDQLNEACSQLYQQNQNLVKQVQQLNSIAMFKRLDYLFMVLKYESVIKDSDFVNNCIAEIKEVMTIEGSNEETSDQETTTN